jgi:cytidyltransferase-like protein
VSAEKILARDALIIRRREWKDNRRRVVFTNGCFDLLHPGHVRLLERARALGDVLVVGLNSDRSLQEFKGPGRPLVPERERAEVMAALEAVDAVTIFDEATPRDLVARIARFDGAVANVAAAVLFFGQFLGDRPFSLGLAAFGVAAWAWFMTLALFFAKEMHE